MGDREGVKAVSFVEPRMPFRFLANADLEKVERLFIAASDGKGAVPWMVGGSLNAERIDRWMDIVTTACSPALMSDDGRILAVMIVRRTRESPYWIEGFAFDSAEGQGLPLSAMLDDLVAFAEAQARMLGVGIGLGRAGTDEESEAYGRAGWARRAFSKMDSGTGEWIFSKEFADVVVRADDWMCG